MNRVGVFLFLLSCVSPGRALAQPAAMSALDIEAYIARVDDAARLRASAEVGVDVERARVRVAGARPGARVDVGLAQLDVSGEGAPTSAYLGFTVPIELGARGRRLDVANANVAIADANVSARRLAFVHDATLAFIDALESVATLEVEARTLASYERVVEASTRRLARGAIAEGEMLDAVLAAARARVRVETTQSLIEARGVALVAYLLEPLNAISPEGDLDVAARTFDEEALVERALAHRPDLMAFELAITRAEAEARLASRSRIPTIDLTVALTHNGSTRTEQFAQNRNDTLAVLVGLPLPTPGRRLGSVAVAVAERGRASAALEQRRREVVVEVRAALMAYRGAVARLATHDTTLRETARARLAIAERTFDVGESTLFERLDVERRLHELELEHVRAKAEHHRALVRLATATGTLGL